MMRITEYTFYGLPEDHRASPGFQIRVQYRGRGQYAVMDGCSCLGTDGTWDYEPLPSSRTDEWIAAHRFAENEALLLAERLLPSLTVNGKTAKDLADD
jgi:hypothetical protein